MRMEELFPEQVDAGALPLTLAMARISIVSAREALAKAGADGI